MKVKELISAFSVACGRISGFFIGIALGLLSTHPLSNLGMLSFKSYHWLVLISIVICGIIGAKIGMLVSRKVKWISFIALPLAFPILFVSLQSIRGPSPGGPAYGIYGSGDIKGDRLILEYQIIAHKGVISRVYIEWNVPEALSVLNGDIKYRGGRSPFSKRKFRIIFEKVNDVKWNDIKLIGHVGLVLSGHKIFQNISWDTVRGFSRICEEP